MTWLVDKSALVRLAANADAAEWANRIGRGLVAISNLTRLEVGFSARNMFDHKRVFRLPPISSMPVEYLTPTIEDRALEVQGLLAERGQHRAPSLPDLLIAATAEITGRVVLHVDKDFELIAAITSQPAQRLC